jgi:hypothetical protein
MRGEMRSLGEILTEMGMMAECVDYQDLNRVDKKLGECLPILVDLERWEDMEKIQAIRSGLRDSQHELVTNHVQRNGSVPYV